MTFDASKIKFPTRVSVTDQNIDIANLTETQQKYYLELFVKIVALYEAGGKPRYILGFTGPSGSGKSVIGALLLSIARQAQLPFGFEVLGIDAFHFNNEYLLSQKSGEKTLKDYKGRFDTYDVATLTQTLKNFSEGREVALPHYSRKTHDTVQNAAVIKENKTLLLIEGLWLLYDRAGWQEVGRYLDYAIFVDSEKESVRNNVIKRHVDGGRTPEDATNYYDTIDAVHSDIVDTTKQRADIVIPSFYKV